MNDDDFTIATIDWNDYMGIFINETVGSGNIARFGPSVDNYPVPCVCLDGWAPNNDRWGWLSSETTDYFENATGTEDELVTVISDNAHYITNKLNVDDEITWSTNTGADLTSIRLRSIKEVNVTFSGKLAKSKAAEGQADYWGMVTVDSSGTIPNRIFWWGLNSWGMNGSTLDQHFMTPEYFRVLKRGCEWAYLGATLPSGINEFSTDNQFGLKAFPNPSSGSITISFNAEISSDALVSLYSLTGQELEILFSKKSVQGTNSVMFDSGKYEAGTYLVKLQVGDEIEYTKMIIE